MKILVLTDHSKHSEQNSVYDLMRELQNQEPGARIEIASRALSRNDPFFREYRSSKIHVRRVTEKFYYGSDPSFFAKTYIERKLSDYDWIILRLPRPIPDGFFPFLQSEFDEYKIINRPSGIEKTSNKLYLLNYPELCPPMKHIKSIEDIERFADRFPIVLKPLKSYGGSGLVKIDGPKVWMEHQLTDRPTFFKIIERENSFEYLGMKYLANVHLGDKRIMISNEEILGSTLRIPKDGSWLCNVSQGGRSVQSSLDGREKKIAHRLIPEMKQNGVILFGFDTLADSDGKRYLSEINTLSLGGLAPADRNSNKPIVKMAAKGIWNYIRKTTENEDQPKSGS